MFYYYFTTNPVGMSKLEFQVNTELNPNFTEMTSEQAAFWEANPEATIYEVRKCHINPPYVPPVVPIEEIRENALAQIDKLSRDTIGSFVDVLSFSNAMASTVYAKGKDIDPIYTDEKILKTATDFLTNGNLCRTLYGELAERVNVAETEEELNDILDEATTRYNEIKNAEDTIEKHRISKLQEIELYDTSTNVNCFYLNEMPMWLDKETRMSLMNTIDMCERVGRGTMNIWFGDVSYELEIQNAKAMLAAIEIYAMECYNVTARHKVVMKNLADIDEIDGYDVTVGYPEKLHL